uniref:Uncharacterized protein n=1 Tax=viral metagenome TaxID=1070528 RepID=A0A6M3JPP8_9ZZZZ
MSKLKSKCLKCEYCKYDTSVDTATVGHMVKEVYVVDKVLIPGTYLCDNPESEFFGGCVVGHLGCDKMERG